MVGAAPPLAVLLSRRLPVFYGWAVLASLCCAGFARQGPAVATFSIFVAPLSHQFGWSRTALSGAASLGGVLAAVAAPLIGPLLDRHGARLILCAAVLATGAALVLLSLTPPSLIVFYALFCVARMNWAAPFELGLYGALNNWFIRRRTMASSIATLAQMAGLVAMPLVAQFAIVERGWRAGWLALGSVTLIVGFVPSWALLVRRPEDLGLKPDGGSGDGGGVFDGGSADAVDATAAAASSARRGLLAEPLFSRRTLADATAVLASRLLMAADALPVQGARDIHAAKRDRSRPKDDAAASNRDRAAG